MIDFICCHMNINYMIYKVGTFVFYKISHITKKSIYKSIFCYSTIIIKNTVHFTVLIMYYIHFTDEAKLKKQDLFASSQQLSNPTF